MPFVTPPQYFMDSSIMSSETRNEAAIFNAARKIAERAARGAYLADACRGDSALQARVERLLSAFAEESQFLEQPAPELGATLIQPALSEDRARSLDAGLAAAFGSEQAVVLGDGNHSVLKMLGQTLDKVPRVALRESRAESADPIVRPKSAEMPQLDSDSRYRLDGEIARGGMGAILKGRDTDLGRDLAIKVLLDQHKDKPEVVQRFIEEAQIGGQLQHPGVAPIYELGQFADRRPFFSMKLVKGETLSKLLADRKEPAAERGKFIGIFEQICQTMAYVHSRGVIHRDLKPANIMVGAFGEVQVMDWGLAKVLPAGGVADEKAAHDKQQGQSIIQTLRSKVGSDAPGTFGTLGSQTQMGSMMGTPAYMPPEQALGEIDNLDERADVFGLGAILCEILTGKPPYVADDGTRVYRMASRGKLEECFQRLDACGADAELIALTKHCLELEPQNRPRDAGELSERVSGYLESVETKLRETERAKFDAQVRAEELRRRQKLAYSAGAAIAASLLIGLTASLWLMRRAEVETVRATGAEQKAIVQADRATKAERNALKEADRATKAEAVAVQEKEMARQALGRSQTSLAEAAYREFDSPAMLATLESVPEDLRDGDWHYLRGRAENSQTVFTFPNENSLGGVAAHPKKPGVFVGALGGNMFVFVDSLSGQRVFEFPGTDKQRKGQYCRSLDISRDGTRMIVGTLLNGSTAIYDTATGKPLAEWDTPGTYVEWVRFSPDGTKVLEFTSAYELSVRDATSGKELWRVKSGGRAVFSPTGEVIGLYGRAVRVQDGATGALIKTLPALRETATFPVLSPDGSVVYLGCIDGVVRGQRLADGVITFEQRLTDSRQTVNVALSADGRRLLGVVGLHGQRRMARVWATDSGVTLQTLMGGTGGISSLAVHPLTDEAIITGTDTRTWALATREVESPTAYGSSVASVFWGAEDVFITRDKSAKYGADGRWSDLPFSLPEECRGGSVAAAAGEIAAFGKSAGAGSTVAIFRRTDAGPTLLHTVRTKAALAHLRVSPDGRRIVTVDPYVTTEVFDTATGELVCVCDGKLVRYVLALDWIGADRIVAIGTRGARGAASAEERVFVWDAATGKVLCHVRNSANADVLAVAPDGRTFAEGGENKRVRIRDAETLEVLREFRAHDGAITALAFHPTQPVLATGSTDLTVRLWNLNDLSLIEEMRPSATESMKLSFSPRGTRLASTDRGAGVSFLNLTEPPLGKFTRRISKSVLIADLSALRKVAIDHARAGRFAEAKAAFAAVLQADSSNSLDWLHFAIVLAQLGDEAAYRVHCHEFLARFSNTTSASSMERAGKACLLLPLDPADCAIALRLAHQAIVTDPQGALASYYRLADGLAHYRGGDFEKAGEVLTPLTGNATLHFSTSAGALLALVQHQLGKTAEAQAGLERADALAAQAFPPPGTDLGGNWNDVLLSRLLLKEARATIAPGTQPPTPPPSVMAQVHARAGRWEEARTAFAATVKETPDGYYTQLQLAILLAQLGDRTAHRPLAHEMIVRFGDNTNLTALSCTAKANVLFPIEGMDDADRAAVIRIADTLMNGGAKSPFYEFDASLARYRAGDYSNAAAPILQRGEAYSPYVAPGARALLALAQHRLGQTDEARATLARAEVLAELNLPKPGADLGSAWHDVLVSQMLLREARETIGGK